MCPRCGMPLQAPLPEFAPQPADQNMPEWMRALQGAHQAGPAMPPPGAMPASDLWNAPDGGAGASPAQGSLAVGSLMSEDALPEWLRAAGEPQGPSAANAGQAPWGPPPYSPSPYPPAAGGLPATAGWGPSANSGGAGAWPPAGPTAPAGQYGSAYSPPAGGAQPPMGAAALFNDSALPDWLLAASAGFAPEPQPPLRQPDAFGGQGMAAAQPGYGIRPSERFASPPAGQSPEGGLSAHALFDAEALPTWLGGSATEQPPAAPPAPLGGNGLQMSSLVDERSLPFWLRQEPETPATEAPAVGSVSRWLAGPVTDEPLPAWLNQVYDAAQVPRVNLTPPVAPYAAGNDAPSAPPLPGGTSGAQLVDDSALPDWLRAQAGPMPISDARAGVSPAGPMAEPWQQDRSSSNAPFSGGWGSHDSALDAPNAGLGSFGPQGSADWGRSMARPPAFGAAQPSGESAPAAGVNAFSASDLIDPGALPSWAQQGAPPPQAEFSSSHGWTDRSAAMPQQAGHPSEMTGPPDSYRPGARQATNYAAAGPAQDGAGLPSWLQAPAAPAAASRVWETGHIGAQRPPRPAIPASELPPWLQNQPASPMPTARPGMAPGAGAPADLYAASPQGRGWDAGPMPGEPAAAGFAGGGAAGNVEHYIDRFGDEGPGAGGRFGYAFDNTPDGPGAEPYGEDFQPDYEPGDAPETGRRKRKRRRN